MRGTLLLHSPRTIRSIHLMLFSAIRQDLSKRMINATLLDGDIENRVANSTILVVLLTKDALRQKEVILAMTAARHYYKQLSRVLLVRKICQDICTAQVHCLEINDGNSFPAFISSQWTCAVQKFYSSFSVHDASSCVFPSSSEQPEYLVDLFSEKAITFLSCTDFPSFYYSRL